MTIRRSGRENLFLQVHTLRGFAGVLLNRDENGEAKRLFYGKRDRTRISSQCLKRHWRIATGSGPATRSSTG